MVTLLAKDSVRESFVKRGIDYYEPELNLVIGRTPQIPQAQWRWLTTNFRKDIKILTYDNLLDQMRGRLLDREKTLSHVSLAMLR